MYHMKSNCLKPPPLEGPKARLLAAAARVWSRDPAAGLGAIAQAAGVGRATLHRYFPGRPDLLRQAGVAGLVALAEALEGLDADLPPEAALRALFQVLVPFGDRLHFLVVTPELEGDSQIQAAEARVDARVLPLLERCTKAGLLRADLPPGWRDAVLEALLYATWAAVARGEVAPLAAPGLLHETVMRGLGPGGKA